MSAGLPGDDPWMQAWPKLRAFVDSGASEQDITAYARELARGLPDGRDPVRPVGRQCTHPARHMDACRCLEAFTTAISIHVAMLSALRPRFTM
ncbi:MAG: hypothetical protein ACRDRY_11780 [Pseudonocardiaceae bacterium]